MPARADPVNKQAVDAVFPASALPSVGPADQQPDDAVRDARLVEAIDQEGAGRGGLLGRLEHHRIAREQRRDDVAVGKVRGEIIGPEHRQHAMRLVAHGDLIAHRGFEPPRRGALRIAR